MAADVACGSCGTGLRESAKFCDECGARTDICVDTAEYKQVTVLFADVVHSMYIASVVGAERLREIMALLVDRATAVVKQFGGTVDKFTGDGIMAVFGAPAALEDHAVRACLAALGIQEQAKALAAEIEARDGVEMRLRIGLNSGQVIAGEIGSGALGYTAVGEQVGMAQRMESVAPPGGVMLSASTARLVEGAAALGAPEMVRIKGAEDPVAARRLLGMGDRHSAVGRGESNLVGRRWEMAAVEGLLERAIEGHGAVVTVVGSPGIGKSRLVREVAAIAATQGVEVFSAFCESHARDIPFQVVSRLLRAATDVRGLDGPAGRDRVRSRVPDADPEDVLLFDDLLGIADPEVELPKIDPDARRRRLTALVNAASLARKTPAVYVVEDAHWIDEVSESMLAEFLTVIPQTPSLVLVTYRPEYRGALSQAGGAQTIALAPLSDSETAALVCELLGSDRSVGALGQKVTERAAGNPFFAEEIVRELAERGVLRGNRSAYVSTVDAAEVTVPATVQATIAARIDRLNPKAKRTLTAAAVIGAKFSRDLLETVGIDPVLNVLVGGQLIDQVSFSRQPEYVFHHPLIRTVAYESQLKSDRAEVHRRLAAAIQEREPKLADENAALIAEHLEAAGDLHAAFDWHMRAAGWSTNRDLRAAWASWERARQIADALADDNPDRTAMRIAPRTMLCSTGWRVHSNVSERFGEFRELCTAAGDKASLAIGMVGLVAEHFINGRVREASQVGSELMALVEAIGDPTLTLGLATSLATSKFGTGEMAEALRWSQIIIDLAQGDPAKGNVVIGSPLAVGLAIRGSARYALGDPGWRDDLDRAVIARGTDAWSRALVNQIIYGAGAEFGVLLADDVALREIEDAMQIAERSGDDLALSSMWLTLGIALMHRDSPEEHERGLALLAQVRDLCLNGRYYVFERRAVDVYTAHERAARGDRDEALPLMRAAVKEMFDAGQFAHCDPATAALVETLLDRGVDADIDEAEAAITRLADAPADDGLLIREVWLLRLGALLAHAKGDDTAYRDYRDRYRAKATSLGFEGHMKWAEAMP
ncbi:MAG: AAA family ATPase [Mycobacterium sp.]|uniref:AAA family ATPase n=1 Tax=Mycobacterium sp. TaxID=1785 RepID=UPI003F9BF729